MYTHHLHARVEQEYAAGEDKVVQFGQIREEYYYRWDGPDKCLGLASDDGKTATLYEFNGGPGVIYKSEDRGIKIIELEDSFQMCTKAECYEALIKVATQPRRYVLSEAVLETLSIIAYKQPVTRLEIEQIRGVKSDYSVNKLIEYNLVTELGRLDALKCPIQLRDYANDED